METRQDSKYFGTMEQVITIKDMAEKAIRDLHIVATNLMVLSGGVKDARNIEVVTMDVEKINNAKEVIFNMVAMIHRLNTGN